MREEIQDLSINGNTTLIRLVNARFNWFDIICRTEDFHKLVDNSAKGRKETFIGRKVDIVEQNNIITLIKIY